MASDAKACFSSKAEYRAVIRYLYLKGKTGKEIHGELADVYGSSAPSYAQVKFWVGVFHNLNIFLKSVSDSEEGALLTENKYFYICIHVDRLQAVRAVERIIK